MKKKRKTGLPRLTVLAYNRRELARWVEATEQLVSAVNDLKLLLPMLAAQAKRSDAARKANASRRAEKAAAEAAVSLLNGEGDHDGNS